MAILSSPLQYLTQTPPVTRTFALLLTILSLLNFYLQYATIPAPFLILIPGESIWFPWTLLTAAFVETSILELVVSLLFLVSCFGYFERIWGIRESIKFFFIVTVISNIIGCFVNWLEFFLLGYAESFLYHTDYHGLMALQAAVLVAYTQLIPEHQLQLFSSVKIRLKRLPMIYVTLSTVLCLIGLQSPWILIQFGWLVSWTYLRFYKRTTIESGGEEVKGDRSEAFAFIYWFPPFIRPIVGVLSNIVYSAAVKLRLISPFGPITDLESGYNLVPGGARAEAERRRALALKVLDQRLATIPNAALGQPSASGTGEGVKPPRPASVTAPTTQPPSGEGDSKASHKEDTSS